MDEIAGEAERSGEEEAPSLGELLVPRSRGPRRDDQAEQGDAARGKEEREGPGLFHERQEGGEQEPRAGHELPAGCPRRVRGQHADGDEDEEDRRRDADRVPEEEPVRESDEGGGEDELAGHRGPDGRQREPRRDGVAVGVGVGVDHVAFTLLCGASVRFSTAAPGLPVCLQKGTTAPERPGGPAASHQPSLTSRSGRCGPGSWGGWCFLIREAWPGALQPLGCLRAAFQDFRAGPAQAFHETRAIAKAARGQLSSTMSAFGAPRCPALRPWWARSRP
jgi:hypothetical protein